VTTFLKKHVLYVFARLNPEGADYFFRKIRWDHPRNDPPTDGDHDGLIDEDRYDDLDGDGEVLLVRKKVLYGNFKQDPEDPRIMIRVKPGEKGGLHFSGV